jgi:hypothetical protein
MATGTWQNIFAQSRVNRGYYEEHALPYCNWSWPKETWFQARRKAMRESQSAWGDDPQRAQEPAVLRGLDS